ncbi:lipopolysaccharide-induced tumor necrosis factor-alpha factor protein [Dioscorea alata]|uniref:Lipopolysaccharide-induced tumor necrosis factor-alpha factor protein n=1 Tax=Dioscorea alata TaxID=55571 RepID=A0ACB7W7C5_DIOAL|nr:lipopolysaccharide-induced tumor necrosis factor-alpha factor protein [Dioscorea alata]
MEMKGKGEEPALGVPYTYGTAPPAQAYYVAENPYQAGMVPPNAIYGDPKGIPLQQTMYRDTPAPFNCTFCGSSGLTTVRSKPSVAAVVGCMMTFMVGFCFLCPSMDCLWHKYHYCPNCGEKVADFEKSDPCLVVDVPRWTEPSFAVPA